MKKLLAIGLAAFALAASAVSHKDFGRLETPQKVVIAPVALTFRIVSTNVSEVVTRVRKSAEEMTNAASAVRSRYTYRTNTVTTVTTNYVSCGETRLTAADYIAAGWKRVVDEKPEASATNRYVYATGWTETDTEIVRQYAETAIPESANAPRKFSKLKVYAAIGKLGAWEKVRTWLEAKDIDGVNGWMAFILAQELSEDNALFAPLAEEARQLLGLTTEQFNSILSGCELEE